MKLNRRRIRHLSAALLLMWLFSLVAGVAQACVTQTALAHRHASSHGVEHCADAASLHAADQHPAGSAKSACYKFCTEASVPTPKSQPVQVDTSTIQPLGMLALPAVWSFDLTPVQAGSGAPPGDEGGARTQRPIPIVFLRLAL